MSSLRIALFSLASLAWFSCTHSHDTQLLVDLQVELRAERQILKESRAETNALLGKLESLLKTLVAGNQEHNTVPSRASVPRRIEGITRVSDTEARITRVAADKLIEDPRKLTTGARVVPSIKNGIANGFKLYAIRPSSVYASLGFLNGDTVHSINGQSLATLDKAMKVYESFSATSVLEFEITRRGQPIQLKITID